MFFNVVVKTQVLIIAFILFLVNIFQFMPSYTLAKVRKISVSTALFAAAPGGAADRTLIADDRGGYPFRVSMIQILRLAVRVGLFPGLMTSMVPWLTSVLDLL